MCLIKINFIVYITELCGDFVLVPENIESDKENGEEKSK